MALLDVFEPSCGLDDCCSKWLSDYKNYTNTLLLAVEEQNKLLSLDIEFDELRDFQTDKKTKEAMFKAGREALVAHLYYLGYSNLMLKQLLHRCPHSYHKLLVPLETPPEEYVVYPQNSNFIKELGLG